MGEENGEDFELGLPIDEKSERRESGEELVESLESESSEVEKDSGSPNNSHKKRGSNLVVEPGFDNIANSSAGQKPNSDEIDSETERNDSELEASSDLPQTEEHDVAGAQEGDEEISEEVGDQEGFLEISEQETRGSLESPEFSREENEKNRLSNQIEALSRKFDGLQEDFEGKLKYDAYKDKLIDSLHRELQSFKNDLVKKHVQSMIMDIVKVIDDIRKLSEHYSSLATEDIETEKLLSIIEKIPSDLEDVFFYQGVKPFVCDSSEFDPRRQRVLKRLKTSDPRKDKTIAESIRPGYEWEGRILRPEMVAVYVCNEPPEEQHERNSDE